jgi:predicted HTH domain antitoxin
MAIEICDELVRATGLSEDQLRLEIACRIYAAELWSRQEACQFAGLDDLFEFDRELAKRKLPTYTDKRFQEESETLDKLRHMQSHPDETGKGS